MVIDNRADGALAQCCMCGKTGLSTTEDGGQECELHDGRWVCSSECWDTAASIIDQLIPRPTDKTLAEAIADLKSCADPGDWTANDFYPVTTRRRGASIATVLNAVLSGQLTPLETCNARVAAVVREAAAECVPIKMNGKSDNDYRAGYRHAKWECNAAISRLTPADHTAALDAMISRAREVKPLVFEPVPSEDALCHDHWSAPALGGAYHMAPDEDSPGTWLLQWTIRADDFCMKYGGAITRHSSPEDVHSAAQADYTASIHAALRANAGEG